MTIPEIWNILNTAVYGKIPVYELACSCMGLPKDTIYELAEKIQNDMHELGFNKRAYEKIIRMKQYEKRIKENKKNEL